MKVVVELDPNFGYWEEEFVTAVNTFITFHDAPPLYKSFADHDELLFLNLLSLSPVL